MSECGVYFQFFFKKIKNLMNLNSHFRSMYCLCVLRVMTFEIVKDIKRVNFGCDSQCVSCVVVGLGGEGGDA